jgi:hypothetical protein
MVNFESKHAYITKVKLKQLVSLNLKLNNTQNQFNIAVAGNMVKQLVSINDMLKWNTCKLNKTNLCVAQSVKN